MVCYPPPLLKSWIRPWNESRNNEILRYPGSLVTDFKSKCRFLVFPYFRIAMDSNSFTTTSFPLVLLSRKFPHQHNGGLQRGRVTLASGLPQHSHIVFYRVTRRLTSYPICVLWLPLYWPDRGLVFECVTPAFIIVFTLAGGSPFLL